MEKKLKLLSERKKNKGNISAIDRFKSKYKYNKSFVLINYRII